MIESSAGDASRGSKRKEEEAVQSAVDGGHKMDLPLIVLQKYMVAAE